MPYWSTHEGSHRPPPANLWRVNPRPDPQASNNHETSDTISSWNSAPALPATVSTNATASSSTLPNAPNKSPPPVRPAAGKSSKAPVRHSLPLSNIAPIVKTESSPAHSPPPHKPRPISNRTVTPALSYDPVSSYPNPPTSADAPPSADDPPPSTDGLPPADANLSSDAPQHAGTALSATPRPPLSEADSTDVAADSTTVPKKKRRRGWKGWAIEMVDAQGNVIVRSPSPEPVRLPTDPPRRRGRPSRRAQDDVAVVAVSDTESPAPMTARGPSVLLDTVIQNHELLGENRDVNSPVVQDTALNSKRRSTSTKRPPSDSQKASASSPLSEKITLRVPALNRATPSNNRDDNQFTVTEKATHAPQSANHAESISMRGKRRTTVELASITDSRMSVSSLIHPHPLRSASITPGQVIATGPVTATADGWPMSSNMITGWPVTATATPYPVTGTPLPRPVTATAGDRPMSAMSAPADTSLSHHAAAQNGHRHSPHPQTAQAHSSPPRNLSSGYEETAQDEDAHPRAPRVGMGESYPSPPESDVRAEVREEARFIINSCNEHVARLERADKPRQANIRPAVRDRITPPPYYGPPTTRHLSHQENYEVDTFGHPISPPYSHSADGGDNLHPRVRSSSSDRVRRQNPESRPMSAERRSAHAAGLVYTGVRPIPYPTATYHAPEPDMPQENDYIARVNGDLIIALAPPGTANPTPANRYEAALARQYRDGFEGLDYNLEENAAGFVENVKNNLRALVASYFPTPSPARDAFLERIGRDLQDLGWQLTDASDGGLYSR